MMNDRKLFFSGRICKAFVHTIIVFCLSLSLFAQTSVTVSTTSDVVNGTTTSFSALIASNGGDGISLREAVLASNNMTSSAASPVTINIPAGTYSLSLSPYDLQIGDSSNKYLILNGTATAATTIINQTVAGKRVLSFDPTHIIGGMSFSLNNLTISGGTENTFEGGGGIACGVAGDTYTKDTLRINNCIVTNNSCGTTTSTTRIGGGIVMMGGTLIITGSTISNNTSKSAPGGGVYYSSLSPAAGTVTITNTIFSGNYLTNGNAATIYGAGMVIDGVATATITGCTFSGNSMTKTNTGGLLGAGLYINTTGITTISKTTFTGNTATGTGSYGGAIYCNGGTTSGSGIVNITYSRFSGNSATTGGNAVTNNDAYSVTTAENNWWGSNSTPSSFVSGTVDSNPWIVLSHTSTDAVLCQNSTTMLTASFLKNSSNATLSAGNLTALVGVPITFNNPLPSGASITSAQLFIQSNGTATATYNANTSSGSGSASAVVDSQTTTTSAITVNAYPTATSAAAANITATTATLNGTMNANNQSTAVTFEYGETISYGTSVTATQSPVAGSSNTSVSKAITGLTANTTYHFRVVGVNGCGTTNSSDLTFTTLVTAPTATAASGISSTGFSANWNSVSGATGYRLDVSTNGSFSSFVSGYNNLSVGNVTTRSVTGLIVNTTYYYRVRALNANGTGANSNTITQTTSTSVPTVTTNTAASVTSSSATLRGTMNANNSTTTTRFVYGIVSGTYTDSLNATPSSVTGTSATNISAGISSLTPNQTCYFRAVGESAGGYARGSEQSVTTTAVVAVATTTDATDVGETSVTLNGTVNPKNATTVIHFLYGFSPGVYVDSLLAAQSPLSGNVEVPVSAPLSGLTTGTTYYLRISTANVAGYAVGNELSFVTETPLPVELVLFTAISKRLCTELSWKTATEIDNYGFEVEREQIPLVSAGHSPFVKGETSEASGGFIKAGFIEGNGTTNVPKEYSFTDNVHRAGKYLYRLKQIDRNGVFKYSQSIEVEIGSAPKVFTLEQNYPNPFNPATTMSFSLQVSGFATLKIYDAVGREVTTLVNEYLEAGVYHQKTFNASTLASGIYFARLQSEGKQMIRKMLLVK